MKRDVNVAVACLTVYARQTLVDTDPDKHWPDTDRTVIGTLVQVEGRWLLRQEASNSDWRGLTVRPEDLHEERIQYLRVREGEYEWSEPDMSVLYQAMRAGYSVKLKDDEDEWREGDPALYVK